MTSAVRFLADVSVVARLTNDEVAKAVVPLIEAGVVGTCAVVDLELYSAIRDLSQMRRLAAYRTAAFPWLPTEDRDLHRALEIQALIAEAGHQTIAWPLLAVAAVAERHRVSILHYSADLALIGKITGQEAEWVVPEGTL
jgi:predicted nucleic acid-binding protein